jgi:hypothetical protein
MFMCGANVGEGGGNVKKGIVTNSVPLVHGAKVRLASRRENSCLQGVANGYALGKFLPFAVSELSF